MRLFKATERVVRLAAIAAVLTLVAPAARAEDPTPAALLTANEIVTATGATALFNPLIIGVVEQAKLLYLQQDPGMGKDIGEIALQMRTDLTPRLGELRAEVARIYALHFTEAELKELLVFYKSPVGKKLISEQPKVVESSLKFAQTWANKLSDEVMAKMKVELKKKGHNL
mgnify:CR=1 FL=1